MEPSTANQLTTPGNQNFFLSPQFPMQRQYEALRAYLLEEEPSADVADVRRLDLSPCSFRTPLAGLFLFLPLLDRIDLQAVVTAARLPSSQMIPAAQAVPEAVQFFHIDALSSMVGMKVDFDMQLTLAATSLYRMMAQRIGREYSHSQAKTVFRNLLDLSSKVEVTATSVVVTLDKRAHNPYLVASGLADQPTGMPWFGDKKLIIQFA